MQWLGLTFWSSQPDFVESRRSPSRPPRDGQDVSLSSPCTKTFNTFIASVQFHGHCPDASVELLSSYTHSRLLEINSHSLFSRWFSESGKLVQRLFNSITEMVEEEDTFVVVLIGVLLLLLPRLKVLISPLLTDEVESLTAARAGAMAGTEPSDGLRVSSSPSFHIQLSSF